MSTPTNRKGRIAKVTTVAGLIAALGIGTPAALAAGGSTTTNPAPAKSAPPAAKTKVKDVRTKGDERDTSGKRDVRGAGDKPDQRDVRGAGDKRDKADKADSAGRDVRTPGDKADSAKRA